MDKQKEDIELSECTFMPRTNDYTPVNAQNVVERLNNWKDIKEKKLELLAKQNEPKHTFFPQTDHTSNYNSNATSKTKIVGCNNFLKRMELARRKKEENDAILNRQCYNDNQERKITRPISPNFKKKPEKVFMHIEAEKKFNNFIDETDKIIHLDSN